MTRFNNILLQDLGITVQFISGYLDMPARQGESYYDWGDEIEPLVSENDIYFGSRKIIIEAFFKGENWFNTFTQLESITTEEILSTEYGDFQATLNQIKVLKDFKGLKTLNIEFIELNPDLSGALPNVSQVDGIRIDGHDLFSQFGLLIENVKGFDVPELKTSQETKNKSNLISEYRVPPEIQVKVNGIYASKAEMTSKISQLNKLFAKEGLRHFVNNGDGYQCYLTDGHKVQIKKNWISISLKLKVMSWYNIEAIVQEVMNRVELEARPQSDLSVTDNTQPDYVKGKDTFKAADSNKLNGQLADFYAKESDLNPVKNYDLAQQLEDITEV